MLMFGLNRLARGLRSANPGLAAFGLLVAAIGFARSRRGPDRQLVYSRNLKPGEEIRFKLADPS